jgi:hypothetical protein
MAAPYPAPVLNGMPATFWWTPSHAVCAFSTQQGRYPTRQLSTDQPYPLPVMRTNMNLDIQKKALQLVKQFPELTRAITPLNDWYHLYRYWDAVDLWIEGAAFCFFVIHRIGVINKELDEVFFLTIDECAKEWIAGHEE